MLLTKELIAREDSQLRVPMLNPDCLLKVEYFVKFYYLYFE
jgi:hypothetical protein